MSVDAIARHFERRRTEIRRYASGALTDEEVDTMFVLAIDGAAGFVRGRIPLDDRAWAAVWERVLVDDRDHTHVEEYSYYLIDEVRGEVCGFDLDLSHDPPAHRHGPGHRRDPYPRVTLGQAIREMWIVLERIRSDEKWD